MSQKQYLSTLTNFRNRRTLS